MEAAISSSLSHPNIVQVRLTARPADSRVQLLSDRQTIPFRPFEVGYASFKHCVNLSPKQHIYRAADVVLHSCLLNRGAVSRIVPWHASQAGGHLLHGHLHKLDQTELDSTIHMHLLCNVFRNKCSVTSMICCGGVWAVCGCTWLIVCACCISLVTLLSDVHLHHPAHERQPAATEQLVRQHCRHGRGAHHHRLWGLLKRAQLRGAQLVKSRQCAAWGLVRLY